MIKYIYKESEKRKVERNGKQKDETEMKKKKNGKQ